MHSKFIHYEYDGMEYLKSPLLEKEGVLHCFTTRLGGFSKGHLASLNLGLGRGDSEEALRKNYEKVCKALGFTGKNLSITGQVHETNCTYIEKPVLRSLGCDALMTDKKNIPLMSYSADCVPVLLYDKRTKAAATVHSGWRGTAKQIVYYTVKSMQDKFSSSSEDILAAIGPSIGPCCFEIKSDAVAEFEKNFTSLDFITPEPDGVHYKADLWQAILKTLVSAGVKESNIDIAFECTCCNEKYFSCRRQKGKFGAMGAFIELR